MLLKTILNRVAPQMGFVYGRVTLTTEGEHPTLEVEIEARRNSRLVCYGCHRKRPGYDHLPPRRFEFVPLWQIAVFFLHAMRRVDTLQGVCEPQARCASHSSEAIMPLKLKPLTKAQLIGFFRDYRDAFPEWSVEHDVLLFRTLGPVKQIIAFEALRSGSYRPSHSVRVAGPPDGGQLLFQFLGIRHREVTPREHATKWPLVIKAMEEQFLPPVREPLELARVLQFGEKQVVDDGGSNAVTLSSLAVLSAYIGDLDRSLIWCDRSSNRLTSMGCQPTDRDARLITFNQQLRESIQSGRVLEFLQETVNRPTT